MGLSAMDNDGASPSIIVPLEIAVADPALLVLVLSGCNLAHKAISSPRVHCTTSLANAALKPRPRCIVDGSDRR
jgi:hypothetical protein